MYTLIEKSEEKNNSKIEHEQNALAQNENISDREPEFIDNRVTSIMQRKIQEKVSHNLKTEEKIPFQTKENEIGILDNQNNKVLQRFCPKCKKTDARCECEDEKQQVEELEIKHSKKKKKTKKKKRRREAPKPEDIADYSIGDQVEFTLPYHNSTANLESGNYNGIVVNIKFAEKSKKRIIYIIQINNSKKVEIPDYFLDNIEKVEKKKKRSSSALTNTEAIFEQPSSVFESILQNPLAFLPLTRQGGNASFEDLEIVPNPMDIEIPEDAQIRWQDDTFSMLATQDTVGGVSAGVNIFRRQSEQGVDQEKLMGDLSNLNEEEKANYTELMGNIFYKSTTDVGRGVDVDKGRKKIHSEANIVNSQEWIIAKFEAIETIKYLMSWYTGDEDWANNLNRLDSDPSEEMIALLAGVIGPQVQHIISIVLNRASCMLPKAKSGFAHGCSNELSIALEDFWKEVDDEFGIPTGFIIRQFGIILPELAAAGAYKPGSNFSRLQRAGWQPTITPQYDYKKDEFYGVTRSQKKYQDQVKGQTDPYLAKQIHMMEASEKMSSEQLGIMREKLLRLHQQGIDLDSVIKDWNDYVRSGNYKNDISQWIEREFVKKIDSESGTQYEGYELREAQHQALSAIGLQITDIRPDGDCAYNSVGDTLWSDPNPVHMRELAAEWVFANRDGLIRGDFFEQRFTNDEIDLLIKDILTAFTFSSDLIISVLAEATNTTIVVMNSGGQTEEHWIPKQVDNNIVLVHVQGANPHYYGTRKINKE